MDTYKIVILGNSNVGKSCICTRFVKNTFYDFESNTIGASFFTKNIKIKENEYKINIWDTAGQERYNSLASMYYHNAHGAVIVFDITNPASFEKANYWITQVRQYSESVKIILIGNKCDMDEHRHISFADAKDYAIRNDVMYIETSAKENINVSECFTKLVNTFIDCNNKCSALEKIDLKHNNGNKKWCC